jgi:hypothetical protein
MRYSLLDNGRRAQMLLRELHRQQARHDHAYAGKRKTKKGA